MIKFNEDWIKGKLTSLGIKYAEQLGAALVEHEMTTSQIRNVYSEVKRIQATIKGVSLRESIAKEKKGKVEQEKIDKAYRSFLLLRPKVAYAAHREIGKWKGLRLFREAFEEMHKAVVEHGEHNGVLDTKKFKEAFWRFCDLFEAVLAFHKASGGRA
ncbi:type III-A CRISPR-associated protein Csm2 [Saprospira grandis]|uniref:CRISPR system Cms protein Csm2 n=1 Tax=Saprospira grandis (strain Lewin) TaxID=984262 RepID=H6L656_SAPGL|nr:type III-A CRISPR-associated protein Csm2 [Saprospira grandis]AFC22957.1 Csm2 family CRISPR-associated protein [Saprospira grandis str. Lewin]